MLVCKNTCLSRSNHQNTTYYINLETFSICNNYSLSIFKFYVSAANALKHKGEWVWASFVWLCELWSIKIKDFENISKNNIVGLISWNKNNYFLYVVMCLFRFHSQIFAIDGTIQSRFAKTEAKSKSESEVQISFYKANHQGQGKGWSKDWSKGWFQTEVIEVHNMSWFDIINLIVIKITISFEFNFIDYAYNRQSFIVITILNTISTCSWQVFGRFTDLWISINMHFESTRSFEVFTTGNWFYSEM